MKNENQKTGFSDWLNSFQQESWQLEMLASGLSIALLFNGYQYLRELGDGSFIWLMTSPSTLVLSISLLFFPFAIIFLIINLCIHLLCRSLWIGTVGLRSVSGDIDYEKLNYNQQFTKYLKKNIDAFDKYIHKLEDFCSLIFSFTFLIAFCIISAISFFVVLIIIGFIISFLLEPILASEIVDGISLIFTILFSLLGLIYFIDFFTLGFFKRRKRFFSWYMYVYRFVSFITFSSVYRPIYHNLIDNKLGRRFGWWLIPYVFIVFFIMTIRVQSHPWFPIKDAEHISYSKSDYADKRDLKRPSQFPMIASQYIKSDFLEIFIPYVPMDEDSIIARICSGFTPTKSTGVGSKLLFSLLESSSEKDSEFSNKEIADSSFVCMQKINRIYIDDSLRTDIDFLLKKREENQHFGLMGVLPISNISSGRHTIRFEKFLFEKPNHTLKPEDEAVWQEQRSITFWKEK